MARVFSRSEFKWFGNTLHPNNRSKRPMVRVEPDEKYPGMWRVVSPDGTRSDMLNRARANETAKVILAELLHSGQTPAEAR